MKRMIRIGIIGGMSYESTLHYYKQINQEVYKRTHGLAFPDLAIRSVNFQEYRKLMRKGDWKRIGELLGGEAWELAYGFYCDYIAIATNTMHKVAGDIVRTVEGTPDFPFRRFDGFYPELVHIGDCIAEKCNEINAKKVLLLGTEFTMTEDFMKARLKTHEIEAMDTSSYPKEIYKIDRIIFEELCHGIVTPKSKKFMMNFVRQFLSDSEFKPDAIVLGCTELNMILEPGDVDISLIDSTKAHIDKLVNLCLEN